jgi:hypothetical protein
MLKRCGRVLLVFYPSVGGAGLTGRTGVMQSTCRSGVLMSKDHKKHADLDIQDLLEKQPNER